MKSTEFSTRDLSDVPWAAIGGLPIAVLDREQSAQLMIESALERRGSEQQPLFVTSANGQVLSACSVNPGVRALFMEADLIHADGTPLVLASRFRSALPLPERVATTDLFHDVARVAQLRGARFYLLGAAPNVLEKTIRNVRSKYPDLDIAGYRHGYFRPDEIDDVLTEINACRPDVLWLGLGVPYEQEFCVRYRNRLNNVGIIKTSGGLFDHLSGNVSRAPMWMQSVGLEWLHRLWLEPRRLFYRYLTTNPHALFLLLTRSKPPRDLPVRWQRQAR